MNCPKAAIFDIDSTLAEPYRPPSDPTLRSLEKLLKLIPVALMSAASLERMQRDIISHLIDPDLSRFTLFTANAAQSYVYKEGEWRAQYRYGFTDNERSRIQTTLEATAAEMGILEHRAPYGEQFIDYEGYLAFTVLGIDAPKDERKKWDPDASKRKRLQEALQQKLPEFDVFIGGLTTIDITPKGINKSFGVTWYSSYLHIPPSDMLYIGDALYEGGNDAVVIPTGIQTRSVSGPDETLTVITDLLIACS